ncbi:metabotropic glutamate receptor 3-like, partial [Octopus sinensis]|uniref:Metabotropic glutamate receptor 3-like n=1 Tax=Octopus sinensis TaxID=2607531 RepID=A0A6P7TYE8_9MOLL
VVLSGDDLSENSLKVLESKTELEGICITGKYRFSRGMSAADIMKSLRKSMSPTVLFVTQREMDELLRNKKVPADENLVFITPDVLSDSASSYPKQVKNLLTFRNKPTVNTTAYLDYMSSLRPDVNNLYGFFEEYYQDMFQCDLPRNYKFGKQCSMPFPPITQSPNFSLDNIISSTINAVYITVQALDMTLQQLCGQSYTDICYEFYVKGRQQEYLLRNLDKAKVSSSSLSSAFQFVNREGSGEYDVMRYDEAGVQQKVGTFNGINLRMNDLSKFYSSVVSTCLEKCDNCVQTSANFTYIPGDIVIAGVFDVHHKGSSLFSCGNIKLYNGFQNLEAFNFAIGEVNKKAGIFQNKLRGVQLGGVGLDSCDNDVMAANLVSNLNNGMMKVTKKTVPLNPSDIYAYIGGGTSDSSIYLDRILRSMQIPLVGYGATTTQLNDKYEFPNFLRTVPTDDRLAKAIVNFLKHYKIPYIQIVHSSSSFGAKGAEVFKEYALENKICVAQTVQFIEQGISASDSANNVMKTLLNKPLANTVVIFAEVLYTHELLKILKQEPIGIRNNYKFIAAGLWGQRLDVIEGVEEVAAGSVTIAVDGIDIQKFDMYLNSKIPENERDNPWFTEYYEGLFDCYLAKPKTNLRTKCSDSLNRVTKSEKYAQDDSVLNVVNSVFAVALGIDKTLVDLCGVNYTGLCSAFKSANSNYQLFNNIKNVQFKEFSDVIFKFNQEGDGYKGYKFFQVQNISPVHYGYKEIASANVLGTLSAVSNDFIPWKTACTTIEACSECFIYQNEVKRYTRYPDFKMSNAMTPIIVGIFDVHSPGRSLIQCGRINVEDTLHLVAFFDSIDSANAANPKEKIVGLALDTCGHSLHVDQDAYSLLSSGTICHDDSLMLNKSNIFSFFTMHEANAIAAQRVLPYFKMSYLSPDLTDIRFDDLKMYKYLFRSKGSLYEKVVLISRVLKTKQITPVAVVYSDDESHKAQLETFKVESSKDGICIEEILKASDDNALTSQAKKRATRAIVLLTNLRDGTSIMNQTKQLSSQNQQTYLFIGVEDWMKNLNKDLISSDQVTLFITERKFHSLPPFEKKIKKMSFQNKLGLPDIWFDEFYQKFHNCSLTPSQYSKPCTRYETVTDDMIAKIDQTLILNTIAGTNALTESIQNWRKTCNVDKPPAGCQLSSPEGRLRYWSQLNDVEFKTNKSLLKPEASLDFRFSKQVWSPGYLVQELQSKEQYTFQTVATFSNGVLKPSVPNFKTVTEEVLQTILFCPGCRCLNEQGTAEISIPGSSSLVGATNLMLKESTIRNYFHYDDDDVRLFDWPLWAIILAVLTSIGIIFTVLLFFYLLIAYPIRGGTTGLGFLFLIGILGIYGVNFAFFAQASITVCAARRFTTAVVYAICFACLCVKSVDNWRYSSNEIDSHDYRRLSSSLALGIVTLLIVLVQVILNSEWLLLVKPSTVTLYPTMSVRRGSPDTLIKLRHDYEWCTPADSYDTGMALSFIFVIILDIFAICFGSLLWDNEKNYYESRWIVVACLCSSSCFLIWMVVSTSSNAVFRDPAVAIGNFINATALLVVMPLRKAILLVKIKQEVEEEEEEKEKPYSTIYHNIDNNKVFSDYTGNRYSEKFA